MTLLILFVVSSFLSALSPVLEAEAVSVAITDGALNIIGCDIPDCLGNYDLRGSNFSFVGTSFLTSGPIVPPGGMGTINATLLPTRGPSSNPTVLLFNGDQFTPPARESFFGQLIFTTPPVLFPPPPSAATLTPVEAPFSMTGHLDVFNTRTNQPITFDLTGTGIVTGLFGFPPAGAPLGGNFLEVSARYDFTVVPEPATILLLVTGLMALMAVGRSTARTGRLSSGS